MRMKYILLLHKKNLKNFIFIYDNIFTFWPFLHFFLVCVYKFPFQGPTQKLIFSPGPYAEVNIHPKTLRSI